MFWLELFPNVIHSNVSILFLKCFFLLFQDDINETNFTNETRTRCASMERHSVTDIAIFYLSHIHYNTI